MALVKIIIKCLKVYTSFSFYILKFYSMFSFYQVIFSESKSKITCLQLIYLKTLLEDNCILALKWLKSSIKGSKIGLVKE